MSERILYTGSFASLRVSIFTLYVRTRVCVLYVDNRVEDTYEYQHGSFVVVCAMALATGL